MLEKEETSWYHREWIHLRRRLLAGLVVIVPIAVTFAVSVFIYQFIEGFTGPLVGHLFELEFWRELFGPEFRPHRVFRMILTVLMVFLILYFAGLISTTVLMRKAYAYGEYLVLKIPLIKSIYGLSKQMIDLLASDKSENVRRMVMIEYPRPGIYAFAYATGRTRLSDGRDMINLFLPTTPNPTSGFMLLLPPDQVWVVDLDAETGIKYIMTGGVVSPENFGVTRLDKAEVEIENESEGNPRDTRH